jgi:hypothetical protein
MWEDSNVDKRRLHLAGNTAPPRRHPWLPMSLQIGMKRLSLSCSLELCSRHRPRCERPPYFISPCLRRSIRSNGARDRTPCKRIASLILPLPQSPKRCLAATRSPKWRLTSPSLPGVTHSFTTLRAYTDEVAGAPIYAGFHYRFSTVIGGEMGQKIGEYVTTTVMQAAQTAMIQVSSPPRTKFRPDESSLASVACARFTDFAEPGVCVGRRGPIQRRKTSEARRSGNYRNKWTLWVGA